MRPDQALNVDDLRKMAKRRLPKILYDCIESGVEDERGIVRNERAFGEFRLLPRYGVDVSRREPGLELFGRRWGLPFGIAPTGFAGLFRHGADGMLARAAAKADVPYVLSGASVADIEAVVAEAPGHVWYHLYAAKDVRITDDLVARAAAAGVGHLVVTVDNPVLPKRERDIRNGFALPLKLRPSILAEMLTHPAWILEYLRAGGLPTMGAWARYAPDPTDPAAVGAFFRTQSPSVQTWADLERIRSRWPGRFLVKGIQHPDDARRAVGIGADAVIVSNHGGKVFDPLPSPLETLPAVRAALPRSVPVLLDSGVRRGTDLLIALALGADFVFVGRATLYGVVAGGQAGAERAIAILADEVDRALALVGCPRAADLDASLLLGGIGNGSRHAPPMPPAADVTSPARSPGDDPPLRSVGR
ncbi:MAG: alpha-hydroxy acid oxidase [Burkholderiaceae bacterium]|jgi:L-lactate dehydrogenase (cytochrome)/(S)-mandelate dehydrogenase|nr:alpha-hydroxy-acid oxidizing protein [Burkholderiales bacterium]MCZ8098415.1 alpha-hydroxy acid oxidase [Burkholderiales bacterium]MCZ8337197.1 alpha-hydroxy acid oxidase [Burkholderiaceae bacterium]